MIIKTFEIEKLKKKNVNFFLLYGDNEGFKNEIIKDYFVKNYKNLIERYEEIEILNNYENFLSGLMNKSFFENKKLIIVSRTSEKIIKLVENALSVIC